MDALTLLGLFVLAHRERLRDEAEDAERAGRTAAE